MMDLVSFCLRLAAFAAGAALVVGTLVSVIRTFVLPRSAPDLLSRLVFLAVHRLFFSISYDASPDPGDPISITREEFDAACGELASKDIPLKRDAEQAWRDFNGWRVNYDAVLLGLAGMTMAPYASWSSDRATSHLVPVFVNKPPRPH